jgi:hypothetical protein
MKMEADDSSDTLKMEAVGSSETLVDFYLTTRSHIAKENSIILSRPCVFLLSAVAAGSFRGLQCYLV